MGRCRGNMMATIPSFMKEKLERQWLFLQCIIRCSLPEFYSVKPHSFFSFLLFYTDVYLKTVFHIFVLFLQMGLSSREAFP
mmetsp:Transcript_19488/g.40356  ORF Transcript_19488/g.40356 Transcript_19488/m.40356 type:complete len:81 (+) Transcript_19488:493-735(+)